MLKRVYFLLQRLIVIDVTHLLVSTNAPQPKQRNTTEIDFRFVQRRELAQHLKDNELDLEPTMLELLDSQQHFCVAGFQNNIIVTYCWLALREIPAEHNRGDHPDSGVGLAFAADTAFLYKAFTRKDNRGQGLFQDLVNFAATALHEDGVDRLVSTTDWTNAPALRSFHRVGLDSVGLVWRIAMLGFAFTLAPKAAVHHQIVVDEQSEPAATRSPDSQPVAAL